MVKTDVLDLDALRAAVGEDTAAMMITNPSTLGIFEPDIAEAAEIVHMAGGQMYYDGANFNAILGKTDPGRMGFDAVHYNLHKTFSQPHGGGGLEVVQSESSPIWPISFHPPSQTEKRQKVGALQEMVIATFGEPHPILSVRYSSGMGIPVQLFEHGHTIVAMVENWN